MLILCHTLIIVEKKYYSDDFFIMAQSLDPVLKALRHKNICKNIKLQCFKDSHCSACGENYACIDGKCKNPNVISHECDEKKGVIPTTILLPNGFTIVKCVSQFFNYYNDDSTLKANICTGGNMDVDVILGKTPTIFSCTCPQNTEKFILHDVPYCVSNKLFY